MEKEYKMILMHGESRVPWSLSEVEYEIKKLRKYSELNGEEMIEVDRSGEGLYYLDIFRIEIR